MKVYTFSRYDGSFTGEETLKLDVQATEALGILTYETCPFSTVKQPPIAQSKHSIVFEDGDWRIKPDHRGETWFAGIQPLVMSVLGDPALLGLSQQPVAPPTSSAAPVVYPYEIGRAHV